MSITDYNMTPNTRFFIDFVNNFMETKYRKNICISHKHNYIYNKRKMKSYLYFIVQSIEFFIYLDIALK